MYRADCHYSQQKQCNLIVKGRRSRGGLGNNVLWLRELASSGKLAESKSRDTICSTISMDSQGETP